MYNTTENYLLKSEFFEQLRFPRLIEESRNDFRPEMLLERLKPRQASRLKEIYHSALERFLDRDGLNVSFSYFEEVQRKCSSRFAYEVYQKCPRFAGPLLCSYKRDELERVLSIDQGQLDDLAAAASNFFIFEMTVDLLLESKRPPSKNLLKVLTMLLEQNEVDLESLLFISDAEDLDANIETINHLTQLNSNSIYTLVYNHGVEALKWEPAKALIALTSLGDGEEENVRVGSIFAQKGDLRNVSAPEEFSGVHIEEILKHLESIDELDCKSDALTILAQWENLGLGDEFKKIFLSATDSISELLTILACRPIVKHHNKILELINSNGTYDSVKFLLSTPIDLIRREPNFVFEMGGALGSYAESLFNKLSVAFLIERKYDIIAAIKKYGYAYAGLCEAFGENVFPAIRKHEECIDYVIFKAKRSAKDLFAKVPVKEWYSDAFMHVIRKYEEHSGVQYNKLGKFYQKSDYAAFDELCDLNRILFGIKNPARWVHVGSGSAHINDDLLRRNIANLNRSFMDDRPVAVVAAARDDWNGSGDSLGAKILSLFNTHKVFIVEAGSHEELQQHLDLIDFICSGTPGYKLHHPDIIKLGDSEEEGIALQVQWAHANKRSIQLGNEHIEGKKAEIKFDNNKTIRALSKHNHSKVTIALVSCSTARGGIGASNIASTYAEHNPEALLIASRTISSFQKAYFSRKRTGSETIKVEFRIPHSKVVRWKAGVLEDVSN